MQTLERDDLAQMLENEDDLTLIEVLAEESFEDFHLPGAWNVPVDADTFDERVQAIADKDDTVVVYCWDIDCDASPRAAKRLEELGFSDVLDYAAGKEDWRGAGLPTE